MSLPLPSLACLVVHILYDSIVLFKGSLFLSCGNQDFVVCPGLLSCTRSGGRRLVSSHAIALAAQISRPVPI